MPQWFGKDTDWNDVRRIATGISAFKRVGAGHDPVSLDVYADAVLDIGVGDLPQEIGLDDQDANTVFAGPTAAPAAKPDFRLLVAADIPDHPGRVPVGGIILWSGTIASIPANWALCDGTGGTPDLRDRFVVGAGNTYAVGAVGGAVSQDLTHTHGPGTLSTNDDTHSHDVNSGDSDTAAGTTFKTDDTGVNDVYGTHTHGPGDYATDDDTHSHAVDDGITDPALGVTSILPPYYSLAYIMRTA